MTDDNTDKRIRVPKIRFTRRMTVWLVGAAALVSATGAVGLVAGDKPTAQPTVAAHDENSTQAALDAIVKQHPEIGKRISDLVRQRSLPKPAYVGDTGRVGVPKYATLPGTPAGSVAHYVPGSVAGDFNLLQLGSLALWVGCSPAEAPIAAAIAAAESGGNPGAQGDTTLMDGTWDWSQGLWQIRGLHSERGTGGLRDSLANADPEKNARAMYTISSGCTDWTPWSTYVSGAYLSYLGMSKTAVLAAKQYQNQTGALPDFGSGGGTVTVPTASSSRTRSAHPSAHPSSHKNPPSSGHKRRHGSKHHTTSPKPAPTSKVPAAPTSKAPVPTSKAPKPPNPVSSIVSRVTSAVPTKSLLPSPTLPLPSSTKIKVPIPSLTTVTIPVP